MSKQYPNSVQYVEPTDYPNLSSQLNQAAITNYDQQKEILAAHLKSVGFYENNIIPNLSNLAVELMNSYWTDFVLYAQTVMKNSKLNKDRFIDIIQNFLKSKSPLYSFELKTSHLDAFNQVQISKDAADKARHDAEAAEAAEQTRLQRIEELTKKNNASKINKVAAGKADRLRIAREAARVEADRVAAEQQGASTTIAKRVRGVLARNRANQERNRIAAIEQARQDAEAQAQLDAGAPAPDAPAPDAPQRGPALLGEYESIYKDINGKYSASGGIVKTSARRSMDEWLRNASIVETVSFGQRFKDYKNVIRYGSDQHIIDMFLYRQSLEHPQAPQGTGFKKKRVYRGRGSSGEEETLHRYYVDTKRLNNGVLCVRYRKNHAVKMKPIEISQAVKECILDICNDRFSSRIYDTLSDEEKKIVYRFVKELNLPLDIKNESVENTFKEFEILKGEIVAGNDNPEVKRRLKICIHDLVQMKRMPQQRGLQILAEL
jgi:hypothetical protein